MDQDKQTLLEAAKAALFGARFDCGGVYLNLRDAIAREEAKPATDAQVDYQDGRAAWWRIRANKANDRAKKAEADAEWHRKESARLSAELALAKNQMTLAIERSERLSGQLRGCEYDLGQAGKLRQRAEKAEADVRLLRDALASAHSLPADTPTKDLIAKLWEGINGNAEQLSRTGHELPLKVSKVLPQVVDELLRLRAELEERREDGVVTAQDVCDLRARAMRAEAKLARVGKQLARLVELQVNPPIAVTQPFEGDPQTCAFGSNAFRGNREVAEPTENNDDPVDPVTGWTFDTYRRVVEALGGKS